MPWQQTGDGIQSIPITAAMLVIFVGVFVAEISGVNVAILMGFPWRLGHGETWRLLTSTMVHAGLLHVGFNAMMFFRLNQAIERWLGPVPNLLMIAFFAVGAGAAQTLFAGGYAVGASGVVYGLFGFLWVCRRRYDIAAEFVTPQLVQTMLGWLVVCAIVNQFGGNIANTAHIVGLGLGVALGQMFVARRNQRILWICGTFSLWLALAAMTWLPVWERTLGKIGNLAPNSRSPRFFHFLDENYASARLPTRNWPEWEEKLGHLDRGF